MIGFCLLNLSLSGCLKTRLNIKDIHSSPQKLKIKNLLKETADTQSKWDETQEALRKFNGRIEDLEKKIEQKKEKQSKAKFEKDLKLTLIQEQLNNHFEALKKIRAELHQIKQKMNKKKIKKKNPVSKKKK